MRQAPFTPVCAMPRAAARAARYADATRVKMRGKENAEAHDASAPLAQDCSCLRAPRYADVR